MNDPHTEQTTKQPVWWMCANKSCRNGLGGLFEFESDYQECPKCGNKEYPIVQKRALIHLLLEDRKGPIQGETCRYKIACSPQRETLATYKNGEAVSDNPKVINCPGCILHEAEAIAQNHIAMAISQ